MASARRPLQGPVALALLLGTLAILVLASPAASVEVHPSEDALPEPLYAYGLAELDETAYLVGGGDQEGSPTDQILALDASGDATPQGTLPEPLLEPGAAAMGSTVYVFGGVMEGGELPETTDEILAFDTATGTVSEASASLPRGIASLSAVPMGGYIYLLGGFEIDDSGSEATFEWQDAVYRFDPSRQSLETLSVTLPTGRAQMGAVNVGGSVLLMGGMAEEGAGVECPGEQAVCPTGEILRFTGDSIGSLGSLPEPVRWSATALFEDRAYVLGGCRADCGPRYGSSTIFAVDTATGESEQLPLTLPDRVGRYGAIVDEDGWTLLPGGWRANEDGYRAHEQIHAVQLGPTAPWAPREVTANPGLEGSVELDWQAPAYDGGASITGYQILRGSGERSLQPLTLTGEAPFVDEEVEYGSSYRYQVKAVNDQGPGTGSEVIELTPSKTPDAPEVTVQGADERIVVQWAAPEQTGGSDIQQYRLKAYASDQDEPSCEDAFCRDLEPDARYFEITSLDEPIHNGDTYTVQVQAENNEGWGPYSPPASATANPVPDPPTDLRLDGKGLASDGAFVNLTWSPSPSSDHYIVYRGTSLGTLEQVGTTETLRFTEQPVPRGEDLVYAVSAVTEDRESPVSQTVRTVLPEPPDPVRDLDAELRGDRVTVTWRVPSDLGGGVLDGYDVIRTQGVLDPDDADRDPQRVQTEAYHDDAPTRGSTLAYHVRAVTTGGESSWATTQVRVPSSDAGTPPDAVLSVVPSNPQPGSRVTFDASGSHDAEGITAYRFTFGDGERTGWQSNPRAAHTYHEEGIYTASLEARDVDGKVSKPATATVAVTTGQASPPDAPDDDPARDDAPLGIVAPLVAIATAATLACASRD